MMSFTMRTENGVVTVDATDPNTGLRRLQQFANSQQAFEALRQWEAEAEAEGDGFTGHDGMKAAA